MVSVSGFVFFNGVFKQEFVLYQNITACVPGLRLSLSTLTSFSSRASVQILLCPGCCCFFVFPFVLLVVVKPKFKGDSHFLKLGFYPVSFPSQDLFST